MTPIYLDIMRSDGTFIQQMRYTKRGFPKLVDGVIREVHDFKDLQDFVFSQRPSLRGTGITIIPSSQRVCK